VIAKRFDVTLVSGSRIRGILIDAHSRDRAGRMAVSRLEDLETDRTYVVLEIRKVG
jgi:hypothetical protein